METTEITGTIHRFLFHNPENDFAIFVLSYDHGSMVVKGNSPHLYVGQEVVVHGTWTLHHKFGKQLQAHSITQHTPHSITGIKKYLASGLIKGIGETYADKLVNHFGTRVLRIIEEEPHRLHEIPGIGEKRIETITKAWQEQKAISHIMVFLQEKQISTGHAIKLYKTYGQNTIAVLQENPYRAAHDVWGIGFKVADTIAYKLGYAHNNLKRIAAGMIYTLSLYAQSGHLYCEVTTLKDKAHQLLGLHEEDAHLLKQALHHVYEQRQISVVTDANNMHYVGPAQHYAVEQRITRHIAHVQRAPSILQQKSILCDHTQLSQSGLHEQQVAGIQAALSHKISIITGGPGTGKTTLVRNLLTTVTSHSLRCKLAAPTGRAAKRLMESTNMRAHTIHRLLEFDVSTMKFRYNEENPLPVDMLIVDEISMVDVFLFLSLLKAIPEHAHLVLIGDKDQLPSVGPGNVLKDMIHSGCIPVTYLTHIFRQGHDALIVTNAHKVNQGEFPITPSHHGKNDFIFIKERDPQNIHAHIKRALFVTSHIYNVAPDNMHILTPMNKGASGTQQLNTHVQSLLNPNASASITIGMTTYKTGDRVMQTRNNYEKQIFNGDVGYVSAIDHENRTISVTYPERTVTYHAGDASEITLAYAVTIHKSQGSEYPGVIIPIFMQHFTLLQRNLLYTAITRAQQVCILIGDPKAIGMTVNTNNSGDRITFLPNFLREQCDTAST